MWRNLSNASFNRGHSVGLEAYSPNIDTLIDATIVEEEPKKKDSNRMQAVNLPYESK